MTYSQANRGPIKRYVLRNGAGVHCGAANLCAWHAAVGRYAECLIKRTDALANGLCDACLDEEEDEEASR